eukprot:m.217614 g.217614  ORF g.217614 m.217614 type:complete len:190 (+) comp25694_c0_seq5:169-738(+)
MPKDSVKSGKKPKTVVEKVIASIVDLDQDGGSSRQAILKHARDKYGVAAPSAIAKALKAGVAAGTLSQTKQTFAVVGHTPTAAPVGEQLEVIDVKVGDGDTAEVGAECTMKYVGTLEDGTRFDAAPSFKFTLGAGEVIKGWEKGVLGMRVGGKRKLVCPPKLGYGKRGSPPEIPPDSTLHFEITLKGVG